MRRDRANPGREEGGRDRPDDAEEWKRDDEWPSHDHLERLAEPCCTTSAGVSARGGKANFSAALAESGDAEGKFLTDVVWDNGRRTAESAEDQRWKPRNDRKGGLRQLARYREANARSERCE